MQRKKKFIGHRPLFLWPPQKCCDILAQFRFFLLCRTRKPFHMTMITFWPHKCTDYFTLPQHECDHRFGRGPDVTHSRRECSHPLHCCPVRRCNQKSLQLNWNLYESLKHMHCNSILQPAISACGENGSANWKWSRLEARCFSIYVWSVVMKEEILFNFTWLSNSERDR